MISGKAMLACTCLVANHSARRKTDSSSRPSAYTLVLMYCAGALICVSKSRGRSVDGFGLDEGDKADVNTGKRYGAIGM